MRLSIRSLNNTETDEVKELINTSLAYFQTLFEGHQDLGGHSELAQIISRNIEKQLLRFKQLSSLYQNSNPKKALVLSFTSTEISSINLALDFIQKETKLDESKIMIQQIRFKLSSQAENEKVIPLYESEEELVQTLIEKIETETNAYQKLTVDEKALINQIQKNCLLTEAEIVQFPKSEKKWITHLQTATLSMMHTYIHSENRNLAEFKKNFSGTLEKSIALIDKSDTLSLKLQSWINALCGKFQLPILFREAKEIKNVREKMKKTLSTEREALEPPQFKH